jgi:seryl-tRNA synthetase
MHSKFSLLVALLIACLLLTPRVRAQEDADDLSKMLKEANELQKEAEELNKKNPPASKEKMAEMQKQAQEEAARMEKEEKEEKAKLQAALKKQLEAPGPVTLPEWMPTTPQFKGNGSPAKKIIDDQVKVILVGTSPVAPDEILKSWEAAAADKPVNHVTNDITVNNAITKILFLSTRSDPIQEVRMRAHREPGQKTTEIEISSPLPKPEIDSD